MTEQHRTKSSEPIFGYFVGIGFVILAILFLSFRSGPDLPTTETVSIDPAQIAPGAWREALQDPPMINIGTLNQRCSDCHSLFKTDRPPDRPLTQHTHVQLMHGGNDTCLNCHAKEDREQLQLRNGEMVRFTQVELLCAQCHGPIYNDWQRGTHGKTTGYWDHLAGDSQRLSCTQCHDPHSPTFAGIEPLPGPNTLRMGDQHAHGSIDEDNPLQRWRLLEQTEDDHHAHDEEAHP